MKNVLEIFEALDPKLEVRKHLEMTEIIFRQKRKKMNLPIYSLQQMIKIVDQLQSNGKFTLSNGIHNINFLTLMEIMEHNKISHLKNNTTLILSELMRITTKDTLDEIKPILLFWDGLHCVFSFMDRN